MAPERLVYPEDTPATFRVGTAAAVDQEKPAASAMREKPWNSFFVRMLMSMLGVALPFLIAETAAGVATQAAGVRAKIAPIGEAVHGA